MKPFDEIVKLGEGASEAPKFTREAVATAYKAYRAELRRFLAKRARSAQECDDLVQEVYLQLLRFPPREPLRETQAYLYRVAWHVVNRANDKSRRDGVAYDLETLEHLAQQSGFVAPDDLQQQLALQQQLIRLLSELPPVCREVILKFKCDGLSYKEIAAELGISVHMVEKHIARAVHHIRMANWD
jgi:RNA polymerase sigma factor (sigma-70 family)